MPSTINSLPADLLARSLHLAYGNDILQLSKTSFVNTFFRRAAQQALSWVYEVNLTRCFLDSSLSRTLPPRADVSESPIQKMSSGMLRTLAYCPGLRSLDMAGFYLFVTDNVLSDIASTMKQLRVLYLDYCPNFTTAGLEYTISHSILQALAAKLGGQLELLSMKQCSQAVGDGIILCHFFLLRHLDVSWSRNLFTKAAASLSPLLESLNVQGCEGLGDEFCQDMDMLHLHSLNLAFTAVTDRGLELLLKHAPALRELTLARLTNNVWSTGGWTEGGLQLVREAAPHLEINLVSS